ncbi:hypothetical protein M427DRAFT_53029 [Gonapodya prolifera JEL478]|uniref:Peptidase S59 domain-containing protein n=1 Tax=Gonapodya prolifera (strain JEL478) TaxID=1344416 RepID=A0A139AST7_GONPJ|nr:hypothetical protein M427DRAFT_53029 [Gonapodya prolifera JEL478]|eukprot:KXS19623.1 hypothetical protein M427DRAFT_53029 [Gonapodya prolifera JEL478]
MFNFGQQQPQQQPSLFGAPQPAAAPAFGAQPTAFGAPAQPQPSAFGAPGFGAPAQQPTGGSLFGGGATGFSAGGFGARPATGGLFGAPAATQAASPFAFGAATQAAPAATAFGAPTSSLFGGRPPATTAPTSGFSFGAAAPFGAPAQQPAAGFGFGAPGGGNTSAAVNNGTGNPKFQQIMDKDNPGSISNGNFQTISAMEAYKTWSFEELRLKDYELGKKTASATPAAGGIFGAAQPAAGGFGFGAAAAPATTQPAGGLFGAAAPTAFGAPATTQPATGFGFGAQQPAAGTGLFGQPQQPAATGFGFGGQPAGGFGAQQQPATTGGLFGAAQPAAGGFGFGAAAAPAATAAPFSFGAAPASTAAPSLFGAPAAAPAPSAFGGFGAAATTTGGGLFGAKPATTQAGGFGFGAQPATTQATGFGFGAQQSATGGSLFGAKPATTGFNFGAAAAPATSAPAYSFGAAQPAAGGFGFGAAAPAATQAAQPLFGGFGGAAAPAATTAGLFGAAAAPATGLFGGAFGASTFGAPKPSTTAPAFSFGASTGFNVPSLTTQPLAQPALGGSLFGAPAAQPGQFQQGSLFGSTATAPSALPGGGLFGASGPIGLMGMPQWGGLQAEVDKNPYGTVPIIPSLTGPTTASQTPTFTPLAASKKRPAPVPQFRTTPRAATKLAFRNIPSIPPSERGSAWGGSTSAADLLAPELFIPKKSWKKLDWEDVEEAEKFTRTTDTSEGGFGGARSGTSTISSQLVIPAAPDERNKGKEPLNGAGGRSESDSLPAKQPEPVRPPSTTTNNSSSPIGSPRKARPDLSDYSTRPPMDTLVRLSDDDLTRVENFEVAAKGFGRVRWLKPVDLLKAVKGNRRRIRDIPGAVVVFTPKELAVYPNEEDADPHGEGLNVEAEISLDGCWPRDPVSRKDVMEDCPLMEEFVRKLKSKRETRFVSYSLATGTWTFRVGHFSRYGLNDDDDEPQAPRVTRANARGVPAMSHGQLGNTTRDGRTLVRPLTVELDEWEEQDATFIENSFAFVQGKRVVREIDLTIESLPDGDEQDDEVDEDGVADFDLGDFSQRQVSFEDDDSENVPSEVFPDNAATISLGQNHMASGLAGASPEIARNVQAAKASLHFGRAVALPVHASGTQDDEWRNASRSEPTVQVVPELPSSPRSRLAPEDFRDIEGSEQEEDDFDGDQEMNAAMEQPVIVNKAKDVVRQPQLFFDEEQRPRSQNPVRSLNIIPKIRFSHILYSSPSPTSFFVDSGLSMGRSFRVGWGPGGVLVSRGKVVSGIDGRKMDYTQVMLFKPSFSRDATGAALETVRQKHKSTLQILLENSLIHGVHNGNLEGAPSISVNPDTKFSGFVAACNAENSRFDREELDVWKLASALWDPLNIPGVTRALADGSELSAEQKDTVLHKWRKELISEWLKDAVKPDVDKAIAAGRAGHDQNSSARAVFALLTGRLVTRACQELVRNKDLRLATIVSQMGGCGVGAIISPPATAARASRQDAASGHGIPGSGQISTKTMNAVSAQLGKWKDTQISKDYLRIWQLASGNVASEDVLAEVKDWRRAFGLFLWYWNGGGASVGAALDAYDKARSELGRVAGPRLSTNTSKSRGGQSGDYDDILYHMLRLFVDSQSSSERSLSPLNGSFNSKDSRVAWLLYSVLGSHNPAIGNPGRSRRDSLDDPAMDVEWSGQDVVIDTADRLTISMVHQLETIGLWQWAVFAATFLGSPESRESTIRYLLNLHLPFENEVSVGSGVFGSRDRFGPPDDEEMRDAGDGAGEGQSRSGSTREFLVDTLKVPETWVHEALALRSGYLGDTRTQISHLIDARKWNDAHRLMVATLAPELILNGQLSSLKSILGRFRDTSVVDLWPYGGALLVDYINVLESPPVSGDDDIWEQLKILLEIEATKGCRTGFPAGLTDVEIRAIGIRVNIMWKMMSARIASIKPAGKKDGMSSTTKEQSRMAALASMADGFAL